MMDEVASEIIGKTAVDLDGERETNRSQETNLGDLIAEAMRATRIRTKTRLIITALEEMVRKSRIAGLKEFRGKLDLDIDLDALRGRR